MKKITFFMMTFFLAITSVFAQEGLTLTGTVTDDTGIPLPGANVMVKGTTNGTVTNFDGEFELVTKTNEGVMAISYIGYISQNLDFSKSSRNFNVKLASSSLGLKEIMIVASVAVDRKTPVAVSTVKKEEIELKLGTQELPEILKSTPGVFTTRNGGGFGDGEITMRGFNSENVAVMINGIPVNDMENGRVFWSNWAGLGSVTSTIQTQRGLGASKLAVPSVGGTVNTITESVDAEKGGLVKFDVANDGYIKYGAKVSTGLQENGLAATVYADRTVGDGYVDGTNFKAVSYFLNLSYRINDQHKLAFNAFGAKQRHGQRQTLTSINSYRESERGVKFNPDWGYKNGQIVNIEDNFYHKPQISLNHYWNINDNNKLSTSAYVSMGTGGGGGTAGDANKFTSDDYRIGNYGPVDVDRIVEENNKNEAAGAISILRASRNDHFWVGALSTLNTTLSDSFELVTGLDVRHYTGTHFQEVTDLLGGQYYFDDSDINNLNNTQKQVGDKIAYFNKGYNTQLGAFGQLEYDSEYVSVFISGNVSNNTYRREDLFEKLDTDPNQLTDPEHFFAFGGKTGANFRVDAINNVFFNIGYFERAPFLTDVWLNFSNDDFNENIENQQIFSMELGYGLRSEKLAANLNLYRTLWKNKTESFSEGAGNDLEIATANGLEALHQGIEFDFEYRPYEFLTFTGMVSYGDWNWQNNVTDIAFFDQDQNVVLNPDGTVKTTDLLLKDLPVGRSAQTTSALGMKLDLSSKTTVAIDYNYYGRYFSDYDTDNSKTTKPWEVPDYYLFDAILRHKFNFGPFDAQLIGRINNVFNEEYITRADDGESSTASDATVFFGPGRTFSISSVINF